MKSSVLNFVRQKADEAKQLADLHAELTEIANRDRELRESKAHLESLLKLSDAADEKRRNLELAVEGRKADLDRATQGVIAAKDEADAIIERANKRADEIVEEGANTRAQHLADWDRSIDDKRHQLIVLADAHSKASAELESKQKEYAELEKKHAALIAKHAAVTSALDRARSSL